MTTSETRSRLSTELEEELTSCGPQSSPRTCLQLPMSARYHIDDLRAKLSRTARPAIAMAAHNPLAAKLAAEAGFDAVWVSGFELSASYAVPDASILPMSANLEMARAMSEVQGLPLIIDMDTGFGNAVNVAYAVPRFAAAGAAAVVIEDKMFPKDSSLRSGGRHRLVSVEEFQGKIEAAKAAGSVLVIARTEALIAGVGRKTKPSGAGSRTRRPERTRS